jgi:uncharacterized protein YcbK (DUF882 family)
MKRNKPQGTMKWLLAIGATLGSAAVSTAADAKDKDGPTQILQKYKRSLFPGKMRIANTIVRSRCGEVVGAEKCRFTVQPLDELGKLIRPEVQNIEKALNYPETGIEPMPELLVHVLLELSDVFQGAQVCVASGYRCENCNTHQKSTSKHILGDAADVVLLSVDAIDLASYLLYLNSEDPRFKGRLGVGYYPNQEHVHVDVRDEPKYWVDYSSGAEPPAYDSTRPPPVDAHHKHYDRKIAAYNPGSQCPRVENHVHEAANPPSPPTPYRHRWRNVFYTEPPLRGSPDSRRVFAKKPVSFQLIAEMAEIGGFK